LNIGTPLGTQGVNIASGNNIGIEGGLIFFTGTTNGVFFGGNGGVSGVNGAVNITANGTNQNITLLPSGTGSIIGVSPVDSDNSSKLATTSFVNNQGFLKLNSSNTGTLLLNGNIFFQGTGNSFYLPGSGYITGNAGNIQLIPNGKTVMIGTTVEELSAIANISSITKGFLKPRQTTAQKTAISSPAIGLEVYDTDLKHDQYFDGTQWLSKLPAKVYTTFASIGTLSDTNIRLLIVKTDETNANKTTMYLYDGASGIHYISTTKIN
jgi:hypothetical protein